MSSGSSLKEVSKPNLFTPQVNRGDGTVRYRLYRHGDNIFSATPAGKRFKLLWEKADCGLGCKCAADITWVSKSGAKELAKAETIHEPGAYVIGEDEDEDEEEGNDE